MLHRTNKITIKPKSKNTRTTVIYTTQPQHK